jgi:hypothetical protein
MAELPNHIADMCGVVTAKTQSQAPAEEYKAVKAEWDDTDQVMTITYRDQVMGWINEIKYAEGPKYRALSANHQVKHCYTQSQAMNWLIEEAI